MGSVILKKSKLKEDYLKDSSDQEIVPPVEEAQAVDSLPLGMSIMTTLRNILEVLTGLVTTLVVMDTLGPAAYPVTTLQMDLVVLDSQPSGLTLADSKA